ncbi:hypothetical protein [Oricola thermophila]|uniref:Uncharacterized protein n=1 Tax=Oricola thermophila TaxID=2742145 RepID=A0A6N1VA49_9HYPH|nr:hypothetical protein [Oricola thermophila]QKV17816.1 hypothetical protein HTY61_04765 [Oricola thermophila]
MAEYVTDEMVEAACKKVWPDIFRDDESEASGEASSDDVEYVRTWERHIMRKALESIAPLIAKRAAEEMREKAGKWLGSKERECREISEDLERAGCLSAAWAAQQHAENYRMCAAAIRALEAE